MRTQPMECASASLRSSRLFTLNLRGNQRTAGEQSRKEGGKIFGGGSRATVAITVLVKNPARSVPAVVRYTDVGDYLSRERKLAIVADSGSMARLENSRTLSPNRHGDWLGVRSQSFQSFIPVGGKGGERIFTALSQGMTTSRDSWVYSFSSARLLANVERLHEAYTLSLDGEVIADPTRINWSRSLRRRLDGGEELAVPEASSVSTAAYRPFTALRVYNSPQLIEVRSKTPQFFPTPDHNNFGIYLTGAASHFDFCVLLVDRIPDFHLLDTGQFLARWRWEPIDDEGFDFGSDGDVVDGYRRVDNISDEAQQRWQTAYGPDWSKDDVFFYCNGLLHSRTYRDRYAADLKKMLPRIPLVTDAADARAFADAGRRLSELHVGYEAVKPYPLDGLHPEGALEGEAAYAFYAVGDKKMRFGKPEPTRDQKAAGAKADRSVLHYNDRITVSGIPEEAYRYQLGSRSAIEWIIDRYYVRTDKASGIVNDPNEWSREVGDPRYILDLLARIVTVSVETMAIVDELPPIEIIEG